MQDGMLLDRLRRYLAVTSQSDARVQTLPSTPGQRALATLLAAELAELGLRDIVLDAQSILTAMLPGTVAGAPCIGFVAHLDTVDVGLSPEIQPQLLRFEGADLCLNPAQDIWLRVAEHPEILPYVGDDILFSDGTSVLGADNKASIAIVMTLLARLRDRPVPHGDIAVAFVPDEEIGLRGAKVLPLVRFPAAFAYTIDACGRGELTLETFNAAQADIHITGVTAHPMAAKGVMVNPLLVAQGLMSMFDPLQTPEHTDGRDGYWWFADIMANAAEARLRLMIRDFDTAGFAARRAFVLEAIERLRALHPRAVITCRIEDSYGNIGAALAADPRPMQLVEQAMDDLGIPAIRFAMRGGTDGSALAARGLATANYFTGALNFHSRFEFLPMQAFQDAFNVTLRICERAGQPVR